VGKRFGRGERKQYVTLGGRPVLAWVLEALEAHPRIRAILPVVREEDMRMVMDLCSEAGYAKTLDPVAGGAERQDSVYSALCSVSETGGLVLVHDAVRPFLGPSLIDRCIEALRGHDGAIAAVPPKDTIKMAPQNGTQSVERTLDRSRLWSVQTPQVFPLRTLKAAYEKAMAGNFYSTDDAALVEAEGGKVAIVMGYYENIKITTPEDLAVADAIIKRGFRAP